MNSTYECGRCGAAFGIAGDTVTDGDREAEEHFNAEVEHHESGRCIPIARTAVDRARLLVDAVWDDAEGELPSETTATTLLALAEEQRTANLIALLNQSAPAKAALTKRGLTVDYVAGLVAERLGIGSPA